MGIGKALSIPSTTPMVIINLLYSKAISIHGSLLVAGLSFVSNIDVDNQAAVNTGGGVYIVLPRYIQSSFSSTTGSTTRPTATTNSPWPLKEATHRSPLKPDR